MPNTNKEWKRVQSQIHAALETARTKLHSGLLGPQSKQSLQAAKTRLATIGLGNDGAQVVAKQERVQPTFVHVQRISCVSRPARRAGQFLLGDVFRHSGQMICGLDQSCCEFPALDKQPDRATYQSHTSPLEINTLQHAQTPCGESPCAPKG